MKIINFFRKRIKGILQFFGSLVLLALAGAVGIGYGLYEANGTKKYVMEAVEYIETNNWAALYNYAEMMDDDFINEYFFEKMAESKYGTVDSKTLKLEKINEEENSADVKVYYINSLGEKVACDFVMEKKPVKKYVFFNEWKLDIYQHILQACSIVAPDGYTVYLDGVELTKENANITFDEANKMNKYVVPRIFEGQHTIYVKKDMIEVQEVTVLWDKDSCQYEVDTTKLQLRQNIKDYIKTNCEMIVQLMYKNVFEETQLTGLENYLLADENSQAAFMATYEKMLAAIQPDDGSTLNSMNITGFENYTLEYVHPDKAITTIDFTCSFKARGPRDAASGARDKYEGEARSTVGFEFIFDGTNWICSSLSMDCIDYSKKEEVEGE